MTFVELQEKHQQEIEDLQKQKEKAAEELSLDHYEIEEAFGFDRRSIPERLSNRMERDEAGFEKKWGEEGSAMQKLLAKHKQEIAEYHQSQGWHSNIPDDAIFEDDVTGEKEARAELEHDHKAIKDYYAGLGMDIPKATRNRMKKHIEQHKEKWNIPYKPDKSLIPETQKDFDLYGDISEIYEADMAIAMSHEFVPDSTNDRLRQDLTEYFSMAEVSLAMKDESSFTGKVREKFVAFKEKFSSGKVADSTKESGNDRRQQFRDKLNKVKSQQKDNKNKDKEMD